MALGNNLFDRNGRQLGFDVNPTPINEFKGEVEQQPVLELTHVAGHDSAGRAGRKSLFDILEAVYTVVGGLISAATTAITNAYTAAIATAINGISGRLDPLEGKSLLVYPIITVGQPTHTDLANAINARAAAGGGKIDLPAGDVTGNGLIQLKSNVHINGKGRGISTVKLAGGANNAVFTTANFATKVGTDVAADATKFSMTNFTVDANLVSQTNDDAAGIQIYGWNYLLEHLEIKNARGIGLHTDGGAIADEAMESKFNDILIMTTGKHGWYARGPHDSTVNDFVVIDSSGLLNNGYCNVIFATGMNARVRGMHCWTRAALGVRPQYAIIDQGGGNDFSNSHFEGAATACVLLQGSFSSYDDSCWAYASFGTSIFIVDGPLNTVKCRIQRVAGTSTGMRGLVLGSSPAANCAVNNIDVTIADCYGGSVDFTYSDGTNKVFANVYMDAGSGVGTRHAYTGTPAGTDWGRIQSSGATGMASWVA